MHQLQVFPVERELGLESLIRNSASFAASVAVEPVSLDDLPQVKLDAIERQWSHVVAATNRTFSEDLFYLRSILATVGWNKNDDIFDLRETWYARHTADNKMLNLNHKHDRIIGHMLESYAIDAEHNVIADDTDIDALPAQFSIVNGEVIYTWLKDEALQAEVSQLVTEIIAQQNGDIEPKWFVSMECLTRGFDYGLHDLETGESLVVARNQETAFLSQHLKACEGTGQFQNYRIGRVLRDFFFSGKGFTETPANASSEILSEHDGFFQASANFVNDFSQFQQTKPKSVYFTSAQIGNDKEENTEQPSEVKADMTISTEDAMRGEIDALKKQLEQAQATISEANVQSLNTQIADLQAAVATITSEKDDVNAAKVAAEAQLEAATAKVAELEAANAELTEASAKLTERAEAAEQVIATQEAESKTAARIKQASEKLGISAESAEKVVAALASADDEKFASSLEVFASSTNKPNGEKATNLPSQPQATSLPAPMRATASEKSSDDELMAELFGVEAAAEEQAPLNADTESELTSVVASVHKFFEVEEEEDS